MKLGYNELGYNDYDYNGYNEHSVIMNRIWSQIGHFSTLIEPVTTNPDYNEQKWPLPSCLL